VRNVSALGQAYADQQSAERGYLLTGSPSSLSHYTEAANEVTRLEADIATQLRGDAAAERLLAAVTAAGRTWQAHGAAPEVAARRDGTLPTGAALADRMASSRALFGRVRTATTALQHHLGDVIAAEVNTAADAQSAANLAAAATVASSLLIGATAIVVYRRSVARPLARLLDQVGMVAAGHLDQPVEAGGPAELATIARSVESMRQRILADTATSAVLNERLAVRAEGDRIARDLHDVVIQRLFAAGLHLLALGGHHPEVAAESRELVDDLDACIRELRAVIFGLTAHEEPGGLRDRVQSLVGHSERSLGFVPKLTVRGPVDDLVDRATADQVVPALGELLTNVARHARASTVSVVLDVTPDRLRLVVADDGVGMPAHRVEGPGVDGGRGLVNLETRAEALGGGCVVRSGDGGGTVVEWSVPLAPSPVGARQDHEGR
jgi:signal transduction histidine kinase